MRGIRRILADLQFVLRIDLHSLHTEAIPAVFRRFARKSLPIDLHRCTRTPFPGISPLLVKIIPRLICMIANACLFERLSPPLVKIIFGPLPRE
jgi:hypothetical protein